MKRLPSHKLKQYLGRPDGELDLHGFTRLDALAELEIFLRKAEFLHWSKVKIITGRGLNSPEGRGILKESVIDWLVKNRYRYNIASGKEGGPGSVIVDLD